MPRLSVTRSLIILAIVLGTIAVLTRLAYAQSTAVTATQGPPSSASYRGWKVQGTDTAGQAPSGKPVLIGGSDGAAVTTVRTNATGQLQIDPQVNGTTAGTTTNPLVVTNRPGYVKTGAPSSTVAISTVSNAAIGLTTSSCYRVACNVPCFYRSGAATPTALTTDNPFFGPAVEKVCIPSTDSAIAFVTASGAGSCGITLLSNTP